MRWAQILMLQCVVAFVATVPGATQTKSPGAAGPKNPGPYYFEGAGAGQGAAKGPPVSSINAKLAISAAQRDAINNAAGSTCPAKCPTIERLKWHTTYGPECVSGGTRIAVSGVYGYECR